MVLGSALKSIRRIYGISAKDLSQKIGISPSYLSEIENNKKMPNMELLEKYGNLFDIRVSSLLYFAEELEPQSTIATTRINLRDRVMALMHAFEREADDDEKRDD